MNTSGQILIEHSIVLFTMVVPLSLGIVHWGGLEYQRTRCAHMAFLEARRQLIAENRPIRVDLHCGKKISETVRLAPLRDLESPDPLFSIQGSIGRASSLLEELSHSSSSSSEQASD
ncbi:MAG: hypothetical protein KGP28_06160 [Bdellovibrionales bacterium]|nr:hypothetical protein [Bdellovibrionales bacterium]